MGSEMCIRDSEYPSSVKVTVPIIEQIKSQVHQLPKDSLIILAQQEVRAERAKNLEERAVTLKEVAPQKTLHAQDLATEKGEGGFVIQRHNELQHLEEELLNMVCKDVATEPLLQDVEGELLT